MQGTKPDVRCLHTCSYIEMGYSVIKVNTFWRAQHSRHFPTLNWVQKQIQNILFFVFC
jgi:hypothetical protein